MKQVVLVTGASSGIGKDVSLRLLEGGYVVYGVARRLNPMDSLVEKGARVMEMDILENTAIEKVVATIMKEQGRLDILINNAGYATWGAVETVSLQDARRQFDVNIFGLASLTKKVIPIMRQQNSGKIINISSMAGRIYTPFGAWYHATKHALEGWSDCLRIELKEFGIGVVLIQPGLISTEFGDVMMVDMLERAENTPYESKIKAMYLATKGAYKKGLASPPSVVTNLILKAIRSKKPKSRYVGGKFAKLMLFIRKWFGEIVFERAVMSQIKTINKQK